MQPINAEVLQGIAKTTFYGAIKDEESKRIYPKICEIIDQPDLTVTYTSFGGVPEPRQLSGSRAATGNRQAKSLADYTLVGTVVEWEDTVTIPRAVIETNPQEIPRITAQMAQKASLFLDRRLVGTSLPSTTALGYDGIALFSGSHAETGSNQDNDNSTAVTGIVGTTTHPTTSEFEAMIDLALSDIKAFTDDVGTPVNAGVTNYTIVCPLEFEFHLKSVLGVLGGNYQMAGGIAPADDIYTGRFRGMFDVVGSPFVATNDRVYIFCNDGGTKAMALLKNKDWEFKSNIGTDSDLWNYEQTALFTAYARFEFVPWNWKVAYRHVYT